MSNTNAPNLQLTAQELTLLRLIYIGGNAMDLPKLKVEAAKQGIAAKAVDTALAMLVPQCFVAKEARQVPGGYVYCITLKSMRRVRADVAASKSATSARVVAVK